ACQISNERARLECKRRRHRDLRQGRGRARRHERRGVTRISLQLRTERKWNGARALRTRREQSIPIWKSTLFAPKLFTGTNSSTRVRKLMRAPAEPCVLKARTTSCRMAT